MTVAFAQDRRIVPPAQGIRRAALVIGNNDYRERPLRNSVNDAQSMNEVLTGLGFNVTMRVNVTMSQFEEAAERFSAGLRPGDVAVFYYSGHGIQVGDQNYLVPVDFDARTAVDAKYKSYNAARVQENLEAAGVGLEIIILDACRDNPFRSLRGASGGLAPMQAGKGTYIAFATAVGRTADDNIAGRNGLFTGALIDALREPGLSLDQVFNRVRGEVMSKRPEQIPWSTSSVVGDFYFNATARTPLPPPRTAADAEAWELVRSAPDPALLEQFLKEYRDSQYAGLARLKLASLRSSRREPAPAAPASTTTESVETSNERVNPKDGQTYVSIPPGTFTMGCSAEENRKTKCEDDEKPAHRVELTRGFWMGRTPVTQQMYQFVMGTNPSWRKGSKFPVSGVTWEEAQNYCQRVGGRLPTEAEWEYAARGGLAASLYGDLDDIAWYSENSGGGPHDVGTKDPNGYGLYDMLGNVLQWTADWSELYTSGAQRDPKGLPFGTHRVIRGASWSGVSRDARASFRFKDTPNGRLLGVGFRCALD
jgi:formylglycine-generating enzyme required for sulfatase activity